MGGFPLFSNKPKYVPELKLYIVCPMEIPYAFPVPLKNDTWNHQANPSVHHQAAQGWHHQQFSASTHKRHTAQALAKAMWSEPWDVAKLRYPADNELVSKMVVIWKQVVVRYLFTFKLKVKYTPVMAEKGTTDSSVDPARLHFRSVMHAKQKAAPWPQSTLDLHKVPF